MRFVLFILTIALVGTLWFLSTPGDFDPGDWFSWVHGLGLAALGTFLLVSLIAEFFKNPPALPFAPSPINDRGHNVYTVANGDARFAVGRALQKAGYRLQGTFKAGPTDQRLFGADVVLMLADFAPAKDPNYNSDAKPFVARSLSCKDPKKEAHRLANHLRSLNFKASVTSPLPDHQDKFLMVTSDAFIGGWGLAFRVWGPKMGKPDSWSLGA